MMFCYLVLIEFISCSWLTEMVSFFLKAFFKKTLF